MDDARVSLSVDPAATSDGSVDIDLADPEVIVVRNTREEHGELEVRDLVLDRANASWFADEVEAHAADPLRPDGTLSHGSDSLTVFGGGHEAAPVVIVTNDRKAAPSWSRMWSITMGPTTASRLATSLREGLRESPTAREP